MCETQKYVETVNVFNYNFLFVLCARFRILPELHSKRANVPPTAEGCQFLLLCSPCGRIVFGPIWQ